MIVGGLSPIAPQNRNPIAQEQPMPLEEVYDRRRNVQFTETITGQENPFAGELDRQKTYRQESKDLSVMFADRDNLGGIAPDVVDLSQSSYDPQLFKDMAVNWRATAFLLDTPVEQLKDSDYTLYKKLVAAKLGKNAPKTEQEYHQMLGEHFGKQTEMDKAVDDLNAMAIIDALNSTNYGKDFPMVRDQGRTLSAWMEKYPDLATPDRQWLLARSAGEMYQQTLQDMADIRDYAAPTYKTLVAFTRGEATQEQIDELGRNLRDLTPEQFTKMGQYVTLAAETEQIDRGAWSQLAKNLGESLSRGFDFIPQGDLQIGQSQAQGRLDAVQKDEVWVPVDSERLPVGTYQDPRTAQALPKYLQMAAFGESPDIGQEGSPAWRKATAEEKEAIRKNAEDGVKSINMVRKLRNLAKTGVDPIRPLSQGGLIGAVERGAYGLAGSIPLMGAVAVNPFLGVFSYQSMEFDRIMLENEGMDIRAAQGLALFEGGLNAVIDQFQIAALMGKAKIFGGVLKGMQGRGVANYLKRAGVIQLEQFTQENIQDLIAPVTEYFASALREDMPDQDFVAEMREYWETRPEVFFAVLPLALIGGGFASSGDLKNITTTMTRERLRGAGLRDEKIDYIFASADKAEFDARLQEAWRARTPEDIQSGVDYLNEQLGQLQQTNLDHKLSVERKADGTPEWIVTDSTGAEVGRFGDYDAAVEVVSQNVAANLQNEKGTTAELLNFASKILQNPSISMDEKPVSVAQEMERMQGIGDEKGLQNLMNRLKFGDLQGKDPSKLFILGETTIEQVKDGVYRAVIKLKENASPLDALEEINHGFFKTAVANGVYTFDQYKTWLEQTEKATGKTLKRDSEMDIIESLARVTEDYILGRIDDTSMPKSFVDYIKRIAQIFKEAVLRYLKMEEAFAKGEIDTDFKTALEQSLGIDSQVRLDRIRDETAASVDPLSNPDQSLPNYSIVERIEHFKNDTRFDKLMQDGRVQVGQDIENFRGMHILLHSPDNAFAGTIQLTDGSQISGRGGVYYPALFADKNYFWASTEAMVMRSANHLNEIGEKNGGKILMGLVSAPVEKLFSSTSMATGVVKFFNALTSDRKAGLSKAKLNSMLATASKVSVTKKNTTGTSLKTFKFTLKAGDGIEANLAKIDSLLEPNGSIFEVRKQFVMSLVEQLSAHLDKNTKASAYVAGILTDAQNKHAKSAIKRGKLSQASILQGLGNMLTEPFLRDFQDYGNGKIYAVLEVDGKLDGVASDAHESYPFTLVPRNKKAKVKLHVLNQAVDWQDVVGKETGEYATPQERLNLMPTSGMSSTSLKVLGVKAGSNANALNYSVREITPQQDADYLAAVERGDMETAQRMVDEAAKAAGYDPRYFYHGTPDGRFSVFEANRGIHEKGLGVFAFSDSEKIANEFRGGMWVMRDALTGRDDWKIGIDEGEAVKAFPTYSEVKKVFLDLSKADFWEMYGRGYDEDFVTRAIKDAKKSKQTSVVFEGMRESTYTAGLLPKSNVAFVFKPSQIKSADPVTRDEQGNVIPLSERFDQTTGNINYSIRPVETGGKVDIIEASNATITGPALFSIRAFHGSAKDFDRFDIGFIGTGEGAQVYGWGLYFASRLGIATHYRDQEVAKMPEPWEWKWKSNQADDTLIKTLENEYYYYGNDWRTEQDLRNYLERQLDLNTDDESPLSMRTWRDLLAALDSGVLVWNGDKKKGMIYGVTLNIEQDELLDWDAPFARQSKKVQEILLANTKGSSVKVDTLYGSEIYNLYRREVAAGSPQLASEALKIDGIVGIKYFDNTSRTITPPLTKGLIEALQEVDNLGFDSAKEALRAIETHRDWESRWDVEGTRLASMVAEYQDQVGTRNFVMFSDEFITITEKNGTPVRFADAEVSYSIRDQEEIDRVAAELDKVNRGPEGRLAVYERAKQRFLRLMQENKEALVAIREARVLDPSPTIEMLEQDRAGQLADIETEEIAEVESALQDNAVQFATRIDEAIDPEDKAQLKADARDRAKILEKGIREKYAERKKRVNDQIAAEKAKVEREAETKQQSNSALYREKVRSEKLRQAIAELDGLLKVLPKEVIGKVGGFATLANIGTGDKALADFFVKRVEMVDEQLERYLNKEYDQELDKIFERAKPKKAKAGEKPKGIGAEIQNLFAILKEARDFNAREVSAHLAGIDDKLATGDLTAEQEAALKQEAALVTLVGNWKPKYQGYTDPTTGKTGYTKVDNGADSNRRAAAVEALRETWARGFAEYRAREIAKRQQREADQQESILSTGKKGDINKRKEKQLADAGLGAKFRNALFNLVSWDQFTGLLFGNNSAVANRFSDLQRRADNQKEDAIQIKTEAIESLFTRLAGGKRLDGEKLRWEMSQMSMVVDGLKLSELEGLTATMMWMQADGKRHMEGRFDENGNRTSAWGYTQAFIDKIEGALSNEAKEVRQFLLDNYDREYQRINAVYRHLNGINLPRIQFYSPLLVAPQNAPQGMVTDPVTGNTMSAASNAPGALRTRGNAVAEPQFRDALQTFIAHTKQMEHWMAYAPILAEVNGVLRNREVQSAIEEKGGIEAKKVLNLWLDLFAQGGNRDASNQLDLSQQITGMAGRGAQMALVGRLGTLLIQSTQLGAAIAEMPTGSYVVRLSKLLTGNLGWGEALNSPYVQRRIREMPPVVQQALEGLAATQPNRLKYEVARIGRLISGADGLMTAGTFAIVFDYHFTQAKKMGFGEADARAYARNVAERATDRLAQPTRMGARSIFELTQTNAYAKVGWAFASEARKNLALAAYGVANRPAKDAARTIGGLIFLNIIFGSLIRNAWRDARDEEDDEWFDDRNWSGKRLLLSAFTEPFYGLPFIGAAIEEGAYAAAGEYNMAGNVLSPVRAIRALRNLPETLSGEREIEDMMKDLNGLMWVMGLFNQNIAAATSLSNIAVDAFSLGKNTKKELED